MQQQHNFKLIFESLPVPYLILTTDFTIVAFSNAYVEVTLIDQDIIGRALFDVFPFNPNDLSSGRTKKFNRFFKSCSN